MRPIDKIIIHCSATEKGKRISIEEIERWHKNRGWSEIGYHFVIELDGQIKRGRDLDVVGSHVQGHNAGSIGICYVGGLINGKPADTMTGTQEVSLWRLIDSLRVILGDLDIYGHNDFTDGKACPSFKVREKYKHLLT